MFIYLIIIIDKDNLAFEIIYENHKKTLNLMAPNQLEKSRWIHVLNHLIKAKNSSTNINMTTNEE